MRWLILTNILLYAAVASQHLFYLLGLESAQRRLSGPAYLELRHAIDAALRRSLPALYGATIVVTMLTLMLGPAPWPTAVALAALLAEIWLIAKRSEPINTIFRAWSADALPDDWADYRSAWLRALHQRQVAVAVGFAGLVFGAIAHR